MKKIALLLSTLAIGVAAQAQISITASTLTYNQDFNSLDTASAASSALPAGWSIFEYGTSTSADQKYRGNNGAANSGETYSYGSTGSTERAFGSLASGSLATQYGAKFVNNTGTNINGFTITYKGEQWRFGGPTSPATSRTNTDSLRFLFSTSATSVADTTSALYTENTALMLNSYNYSGTTATALDGNATGNFGTKTATIPVSIPNGGTLVIKWIDKNISGNDDGLAVDDFSIVFTTSGTPVPSYKPIVTALSPANGATNVAINSNLSITFDRTVTANAAGSIRITNQTDHTAPQVIAANNATVAGHVVTIPGVTLLNGKTYYVMFDSTAFDTAGYKSYGLYDSTSWKFTTIAASVGTVTSLSETFNNSCPTGLPNGWQAQNVSGSAVWACNTTGPNYNLTINGGGATTSNENEDWLITPQLTSTVNTRLYFKSRYNFGGPNMEVLYSTNYSGTGAPSAANWISLVNPYAAADSNQWVTKSAPLVAGNIYIAFKYTSLLSTTSGNARRWDVDSVFTMVTTGIHSVNGQNNTLGIQVLGTATNNNVLVAFNMETAATVKAAIYDMAGREVFAGSYNGVRGANKLQLQPQTLQSGMYMIRISNGKEQGITRTFVQ